MHPPHRKTYKWAALAALTAPVLLMSISLTVMAVAIPALSEDFAPSGTQLLWIVDIYGFFLAALLVFMGNIGDRIGRRRLLLIGTAAFGGASALAAFSWSAESLIAARALLGISGAALMPSTLALIRNIFSDPTERRRALSIWTAAFAGGAGLGPVIGGFMVEHFWWGSVFLINVPVMIVLLVVGPFLLPESKNPAPGRLDLLSATLLAITMLSSVYGLKLGAETGWGYESFLWIVGGLIFGSWFVVRQRRLADPLIDLGLFRSRLFSVAIIASIAGIFGLTALLYYLPQYLQLVLGHSPLVSGLWMLPIAVGSIVGSLVAVPLARRISSGLLIGGGLVLAAIGYVVLSALDLDGTAWLAFSGGAVLGIGIGVANTLANDVVIGIAPAEKAGAAAGISETAYELGGALGTALLGSLGTSLYRGDVNAGLPTALPAELTEAISQTLGGAITVAAELPEQLKAGLLNLATHAFTDAMSVVFLTAAVILGGFGIVAGITLANPRSSDTQQAVEK